MNKRWKKNEKKDETKNETKEKIILNFYSIFS
jgi:hypothetical protein